MPFSPPNLPRLRWRYRHVSEAHRRALRDDLLDESTPEKNYFALAIASCAIATFGLLSNSAAVIIGAMIIAPLMLPIRGVAFGALEGDVPLLRRATIALLAGTAIALGLAWAIGMVVGLTEYGSEVLARSQPTLLDLGIAIAAGSISGYAKLQPKISSTLVGTAIAVALMPPVCTIGLGLAQGDWQLSLGAALLYATNLLGITLACMVTFFFAGYGTLAQARGALLAAIVSTGLLFLPLGASLIKLVQQARLETSVKRALLDRTVTFQQVTLVGMRANWLASPPELRLLVRTRDPISPKQVRLLEEFLLQAMGQPFRLTVDAIPSAEIVRETLHSRLLPWAILGIALYDRQWVEMWRDRLHSWIQLQSVSVLAIETNWQSTPPTTTLRLAALPSPYPEAWIQARTARLRARQLLTSTVAIAPDPSPWAIASHNDLDALLGLEELAVATMRDLTVIPPTVRLLSTAIDTRTVPLQLRIQTDRPLPAQAVAALTARVTRQPSQPLRLAIEAVPPTTPNARR